MARIGVTFAQISDAANQLQAQGKNPTIEQIRRILGTGSSTTIANYLKQWKETQVSTSSLLTKNDMPPELVSAAKGLWDRVREEANENILTTKENYETTITTLQIQLEKYKENNRRWQKLYEQLLKDKQILQTEKSALQNENQILQHTIEIGKRELLALKQHETELCELNKQLQKDISHREELIFMLQAEIYFLTKEKQLLQPTESLMT